MQLFEARIHSRPGQVFSFTGQHKVLRRPDLHNDLRKLEKVMFIGKTSKVKIIGVRRFFSKMLKSSSLECQRVVAWIFNIFCTNVSEKLFFYHIVHRLLYNGSRVKRPQAQKVVFAEGKWSGEEFTKVKDAGHKKENPARCSALRWQCYVNVVT